jgi:hypothetical protein
MSNGYRDGELSMSTTRQFNIRLSDEMRETLEKIASPLGRSAADEIRARLRDSLWQDKFFGAETLCLADAIGSLARALRTVSGGIQWYEHPAVYDALIAAINVWMEDETNRPQPNDKVTLPPDFDPRSVGRTVARLQVENGYESPHTARLARDQGLDKGFDISQYVKTYDDGEQVKWERAPDAGAPNAGVQSSKRGKSKRGKS